MRVRAVVVAWSLLSGIAEAGGFDKPPFTADPKELLELAKPFHGDTPIVVLRDEELVRIDDRGRAENRYRVVFVVNTQAAVDDWGTLSLGWSPFYQDRPTVRARVIAPNAQVAELDQKLITDAPSVEESTAVYSDSRKMQVPLPRLTIGAVVEEEFVIPDREPLLPAGTAQFSTMGRQSVPVESSLLVISAPAARKVKLVLRGFAKPPVPRHAIAKGIETWTYEMGHLDPLGEGDRSAPPDLVQIPYIGYATASSWAAVATDYAKLVDKRIADGPFALPEGLKGASDRETIDHVVAWLHAHVRYTGIEIADAAIVPWPPAETAKRGFGDCKDKSTLLVALLRAAGIEADVALLSVGPGVDTDRDLPGMGVFDHAIVRARAGGKDVWIDATEELLPPGQLPAAAQNRLALIASAHTVDLIRTPAAAPEDNHAREVRTYKLAELGNAAVQEVTVSSGVFTDDDRRLMRDTKHSDLTKTLGDYADRIYHGKLASFSSTPPDDFATPFAITLDVSESGRAYSGRDKIDVYLFPSDALAKLPSLIDDANLESEVKERKADYQWFTPHVYEIENHLVLPDGFSAPALVAQEEQKLGTMTLTTTRTASKGEIVVTYRLHTGKQRITAAELATTRAAVLQLKKANGQHLAIELTSHALTEAGKLVEAAAEARRLVALHPKEAVHHDQLATVYHAAGMIEAARREARAGVTVEPKSGDAFAVLAFELRSDTLGRSPAIDADRKGAIEAYRKALALSPKHTGAMSDFASLLGNDETGLPTTDPHALAESIELLRKAKEVSDSTEYDQRLVAEIYLSGDGLGTEAFAKDVTFPQRDTLLVAAAGLARGSSGALAEADSLATGVARRKLLIGAVGALIELRRYDLVHDLFAAYRDASTDQQSIDLMTRLAAVDLAKLDPADPTTPVRLVAAMFAGTHARFTHPWDAKVEKDLSAEAGVFRKRPIFRSWMYLRRDAFVDLVEAYMTIHVDGNATDGWRVESTMGSDGAVYYVASDHGKARLVGVPQRPSALARYLNELVARNQLDATRLWLGRLAADAKHDKRLGPVFDVWKDTSQLSRDELELVLAILVSLDDPGAAPLAVLRRCAATGDAAKALCRDQAGRTAFAASDWVAGEKIAREELAADANDTGAAMSLALALARQNRVKDGIALVDAALAKKVGDPDLLMMRVMLAEAAGSWTDAASFGDKLVGAHGVDVEHLNNLAWLHLFHDPTPARANELGAKAMQLSRNVYPQLANTLAAIEAESDHPAAAWKYERESITRSPLEIDAADWYVIGRIAEAMGLPDDARSYYGRATKPTKPDPFSPHGYDFAQKHLRALGAAH